MLPDKIMQSDLLDILFENRNKTYGAYALRRSYNRTIATAITITLFIAIVFSGLQFLHHTKHKGLITQIIFLPDQELVKLDQPKPQPENPMPQHAAAHNQQIYSAPVIVQDISETQTPTVDVLTENAIGEENVFGNSEIDVIQPPANTQETSGSSSTLPETKTDETPLTYAQVMPEYPGGIEALKKFMLKNLRQPDDLQPGEKILVMASFVVNKNGQIEQVKIINGGRTDLNKEVQRVINKMPFWKPGLQNGNTVAVYFNLPVTFISTEDE